MQVSEGHDAVGGGQQALLSEGMPPPPPLSLLLEEAPLAQVVLPPQGEAAQGQPQVLGPARLFLSPVGAVPNDTRRQRRTPHVQLRHTSCCSSPVLIRRRFHQDALRSVVEGNAVSTDVSVHDRVGRREAAGLRRGPSRQGLVGPRDVGAGWGQRALTDRLVHALHRFKHTPAVDPANSRDLFTGTHKQKPGSPLNCTSVQGIKLCNNLASDYKNAGSSKLFGRMVKSDLLIKYKNI